MADPALPNYFHCISIIHFIVLTKTNILRYAAQVLIVIMKEQSQSGKHPVKKMGESLKLNALKNRLYSMKDK